MAQARSENSPFLISLGQQSPQIFLIRHSCPTFADSSCAVKKSPKPWEKAEIIYTKVVQGKLLWLNTLFFLKLIEHSAPNHWAQ